MDHHSRVPQSGADAHVRHSYDRQTSGTIVFSGDTEAEPRQLSPFLAWTSQDGKVQKLVRTGNYFPYELSIASDDTIWTLGFEMVNLDPGDSAVDHEARVLRHFSPAGTPIESFLPQSKFDSFQLFRD